ncbi:hypothetical protein [Actinokineospora sp.]|uniref:hypothetical protein n=1 Tax=Actinokineospora sp. TaxID=1872133 RepID=UPI0040382EEB
MDTESAFGRYEPRLLGIYLNDHLGGAVAGGELANRIARAHRRTPAGADLARIAVEIEQDRRELVGFMSALEVPVRRYKGVLAWVGEKAARLKPNRYLLRRSPLSSVLELETMRLGVEGKAAGWRTLRRIAEAHPALDTRRLDTLIDRARTQIDTLESLRMAAAEQTFTDRLTPAALG